MATTGGSVRFIQPLGVMVTPTARVHILAGTAVAGTAPLKFLPGTVLAVTESGAVESDGTNIYWTDSFGTRWTLNNAASETLAQAYAAGAIAADQTLALLDTKGGGFVVDGTDPGFTGPYAFTVKGSEFVSVDLAVGVVTPTARIHVAAGTAVAGTAPLKIPSGIVLAAPEPGAVETDAFHIYWTDAGGSRLQLDNSAVVTTLAQAYDNGAVSADQTLALLDAKGGGFIVDGTNPGFTGPYAFTVKGSESVSVDLAVGVVTPTARIHVAAGTAVAGTAPLKIPSGIVLAAPEPGAVETDASHIYWTNSGGVRLQLDNSAVTTTLAQAYANGTVAADQTLVLLDTQGGKLIVDGTAGGFTGTSAMSVLSTNVATSLEQSTVTVTTTFAPTSGTATFAPFNLSYTINQTGGANGTVNGIFVNATETTVVGTHNLLDLQVASIDRFTVNRRGGLTITQGVVAGTTTFATALTVTGGAHTTLPAATEVIGINFNQSANKQWASGGATAVQREVVFQPPTYSVAAGGMTFTSVATVAIQDTPSVGTNASITNRYSFWVQAGWSRFDTAVGNSTFNNNNASLTVATSLTQNSSSNSCVLLGVLSTINQTSTASGTVTDILVNSTETAVLGTHNFLNLQISSVDRFTVNRRGGLTITQGAVAGTTTFATALTVTGGAHTTLPAGTEVFGINFNQSATKQWATGTIALQREFIFRAPTYAFVGASNITMAATVAITSAPIAGTNDTGAAVLTNTALLLQGSYAPTAVNNSWVFSQITANPTFAPTAGTAGFRAINLTYTLNETGSYSGLATGIFLNATETAILSEHDLMALQISNVNRFRVHGSGGTLIRQGVLTTSNALTFGTILNTIGAALTAITASNELPGIDFNQSATKQWATGALTTQREIVFQAPTYAFVGGSTITTAATVAITNAPIAGANATLTTSLALWVQAGSSRFDPTRTVATAAGAAWDGLSVGAATLTLTGAGTITALSLANILGPTITSTSAAVTTDFYTTRIGIATFTGAGPASATRSWSLYAEGNVRFGAGQTVAGTDVNVAGPYTVLPTDFFLEVRRTATAAITINLPALTGGTVLNGRLIPIKDSGYNAAANNITLALGNAADKIENVNANYIMNISATCLFLKANTTTNNWEFV